MAEGNAPHMPSHNECGMICDYVGLYKNSRYDNITSLAYSNGVITVSYGYIRDDLGINAKRLSCEFPDPKTGLFQINGPGGTLVVHIGPSRTILHRLEVSY